ncbi:MAG: helix-turn-helix transcriptional regulator [Planctomycetia bacterium]|nr:helix-turn-helix transcriptional regulator [Planctomycetia bacterium]
MKDRVKQIRKILGFTQRQLAERLGVSSKLVAAWETGAAAVSDARQYQICSEFGIDREWLKTGQGQPVKRVELVPNLYACIRYGLEQFYCELSESGRGAMRQKRSASTMYRRAPRVS